jgi:hypothetical protein
MSENHSPAWMRLEAAIALVFAVGGFVGALMEGMSWTVAIVLGLVTFVLVPQLFDRYGSHVADLLRDNGWLPEALSNLTSPKIGASTHERSTPPTPKGSVKFSLLSDWESGVARKILVHGYVEEVWLRLTALDYIEDCRVQVVVYDRKREMVSFYLEGDFTGNVQKGVSQQALVFAQTITSESKAVDEGMRTCFVLKPANLWPDTEHRMRAPSGHRYNIKIRVLHKNGPEDCLFSIQVREFQPVTRLQQHSNIEIATGEIKRPTRQF